jgi:membrane protein YqaA with SNARE-associated domain
MNEIVEVILMGLLASVKFLFAIVGLLVGSSRAWYLDMAIVATGGSVGVVVFTYLGAVISKFMGKYHFFKIKYKTLRKLARIMHGYGMLGLALISPMTISIPVGCIVSASFEHDKKRIIMFHIGSVLFWSILLFGLKGIFNINIAEKI